MCPLSYTHFLLLSLSPLPHPQTQIRHCGHMRSHAQLSRRRPVVLTWKTEHPGPPLVWPGMAKDRVTYLECIGQGLQMSDGMGAPIPPPQA